MHVVHRVSKLVSGNVKRTIVVTVSKVSFLVMEVHMQVVVVAYDSMVAQELATIIIQEPNHAKMDVAVVVY